MTFSSCLSGYINKERRPECCFPAPGPTWCRGPGRRRRAGAGGGAPTSVAEAPAAAQAPGPSITPVTEPPLREASLPRPGPGQTPPPAHPALSVNLWVNSVSPPDLPLNPDTHGSVNRASEGPGGPAGAAHRPATCPGGHGPRPPEPHLRAGTTAAVGVRPGRGRAELSVVVGPSTWT